MSCGGGEVDRKSRRAESVALGMNLFEEQDEVSGWLRGKASEDEDPLDVVLRLETVIRAEETSVHSTALRTTKTTD